MLFKVWKIRNPENRNPEIIDFTQDFYWNLCKKGFFHPEVEVSKWKEQNRHLSSRGNLSRDRSPMMRNLISKWQARGGQNTGIGLIKLRSLSKKLFSNRETTTVETTYIIQLFLNK